MHFFEYKKGQLFCEKVPVAEIAGFVGTPFYLYSYRTFERHFRVFNDAFRKIPHVTCYSCKANESSAILTMIGRFGGGADIVSGGELYKALHAGIPADRVVFSGVGKTEEELRSAIRAGILMINIESEGELQAVSRLAGTLKKRVPVSIRVNPEIDPKTHPYITTGLKKNKFGVLWRDAQRLYREIKRDQFLVPIGISSHIGSQILELTPFIEAVRSVKSMVRQLKQEGVLVRMVDIGGGLGITYRDELPPHPEEYAAVMERELEGMDLRLVLEPGRVLVGNSGVFVTKLLYIKKVPGKTFYIVDGAMNDLVRPALYGAYHEIVPVRKGRGDTIKVDVVGPVCESGDFFAKDRPIASIKTGDLLAVLGAGAYGFSMSSNYNARRRVAEVLVKDGEFYVIRKRETLRDLRRGECVPQFLEV